MTGTPEYQPSLWTAIEFELPAEEAPALAEDLAASLLSPGWYANWTGQAEATVIFPGKIFGYRRGDQAARAAAQQHGRRMRRARTAAGLDGLTFSRQRRERRSGRCARPASRTASRLRRPA